MSSPVIIFDVQMPATERMLRRTMIALSDTGLSFFLGSQVLPYIKLRAKNRFRSEGDDVVGKWQQLEPATKKARASSPYGVGAAHPINRRSGELERWITEGTFQITPHTLGVTLKYPASRPGRKILMKKMTAAQQGLAFPKTPPRPVLGLNERDLVFVTTRLFFHLQKARTK